MRGLELARAYYEQCGAEWLRREFPGYVDRIAVGLVGEGSECFGFDDDISTDHDFEPGFCLWITQEDEQAIGFKLMRGYKKLPDTFMGVSGKAVSLFGGGRRGVHGIGEFYESFTGSPGAPEELMQWLKLPEHALACAVNGEVFADGLGEFSRIRATLQAGYPEDVRLKKIAARAAVMAQAGQYNFMRCVRRGEYGAAALALTEFAQAAVSMAHLLCSRYAPYYKWGFRSLRSLGDGSMAATSGGKLDVPGTGRTPGQRTYLDAAGLAARLEWLITSPTNEETAKKKSDAVEEIAADIVSVLRARGLTSGNWDYLEPHALEITERIKDPVLRTLHIMEG